MGRIWMLGAVAALAVSCKPRIVEHSTTAYVLGPVSQIVPVDGNSEPQIPPSVLNASVLIATSLPDKSVKFCSGTLIAPESGGSLLRVLTNHHCFAKADSSGNATSELLPEACVKTKVHFGFVAGQTDSSTETTCQAGSLHTNFDGDVAVLTLSQNPDPKYQPLSLWDGDDAPAGRQALIVHYPDEDGSMVEPPGGGAKLPTASATLQNCQTVGAFDVSEWTLDRSLAYGLRHTCDLIHGSSGSGLIDTQTNTILGVNWGGIKIQTDQGLRTDNVATKASFVAAFLKDQAAQVVQDAHTAEEAHAADAERAQAGGVERASASLKHCGVTGAGDDAGLALLLAGLALPALGAFRRRR